MRLRIKLKQDSFYIIFAFLYFSISNISRMLLSFGLPRPVSYIVFIGFFLVFFLKTCSRMKLFDILYYLIVIPVVGLGLIRYGSYERDTAIYAAIILFLPAYYFFRFCNPAHMQKGFKYAALYSFLYLCVYYLTDVYGGSYSMQYAYWMAQPVCALVYFSLKEKKKLYLLGAALGLITIFISGSRGALFLCTACCMFTYIVFYQVRRKIAVRMVILLILVGVLLVFADRLLLFLGELFGTSRNLRILLSGEFLASKSRSALFERCQLLIESNPIGYGPFASRMLISDQPYPHSIWSEFQLDYGKWLGMVLVIAIIFMSIRNLLFYRKTDMLIVCSILTIVNLCGLFVSSSYLQEFCVPAEIALFVNSCLLKKNYSKVLRQRTAASNQFIPEKEGTLL